MSNWRRHTIEFKKQAVEKMRTCENINDLARELQIQRKLLYTWKYQFEGRPEPRHANFATTAEERKDKPTNSIDTSESRYRKPKRGHGSLGLKQQNCE